eukprot:10117463-Prorocentrum_lima.AAC.1
MGAAPMDVGALTKGDKKGQPKGSGKGSGGENPDKDLVCHHCGRKGHRIANCWWKDQPKQYSQGSGKGKK